MIVFANIFGGKDMSVIVGLTGGIASGKSTISKMIQELDFPIVDADIVAREVVEIGEEAYVKLIESFGEEVLMEDRTLNRQALGSIIFHDEAKRLLLNSIMHPAISMRIEQLKNKFVSEGSKAVFLDIPLLLESEDKYGTDKILVVSVNQDTQLERLMKRNNLSEREAQARINAQMLISDKVKLADEVIDNSNTIKESKQQLIHILQKWELI